MTAQHEVVYELAESDSDAIIVIGAEVLVATQDCAAGKPPRWRMKPCNNS